MSYNILVTGGAGYLGSIAVPDLLAAGHRVTVLDNFMYGQNSLAHVCNNPNFNVVRGDVRIDAIVKPLLAAALMSTTTASRSITPIWSSARKTPASPARPPT
jgi:nucleoside-diphosphate-sugar epimerase